MIKRKGKHYVEDVTSLDWMTKNISAQKQSKFIRDAVLEKIEKIEKTKKKLLERWNKSVKEVIHK